jgi:hypothetical protein
MAKDDPKTRPKAKTAFQKFENLARRIVRAPKPQPEKGKRSS